MMRDCVVCSTKSERNFWPISQILPRPNATVGVSNHMADDGTAAFDWASGLALQQQLEHRLRRVDHALSKFEQGTYGYCENCGQPIDFARLKALPDARSCLKCQRKREVPSSHAPGPRAYEQGNMLNSNSRGIRLMRKLPPWLIVIILAGFILLCDRLSKLWVLANLQLYESWAPIPGLASIFTIFHTTNTGVAFGLFQGVGMLFTIVRAIAVVAI